MKHTRNNMRTIAFLLIMASFLFSCKEGNRVQEETLQAKIDSLETANASQASQLKDITDFMNVVSEGLDSIAEQEQLLMGNGRGVEGGKLTKEQLRENLKAFAALLERQRNRISELEDSLTSRGRSMASLRNVITYLNQQLDEKNNTIASLQASLNNKNVDIQKLRKQVTKLTDTNTELEEAVKQQGEALVIQSEVINEGYVKIGTKKELKQAGILSGGFLKKRKLDVTQFHNGGFQKVDIRNFTEMEIPSKKIEILTQMPESSYYITSNDNSSTLKIINPTAFWSVSNYLVIQTK